ncbi:hypothetical protein AD948_03280 [Acetobacter senegalensis]|uniref:Uncharacterized protein n=1 Tax=Acetobacter senegalensis TaxID=446692 RepID=A0A149U6C1_9PROT|nr:hypothetical protein AD948_03280 [Acetobacter senegalensis]
MGRVLLEPGVEQAAVSAMAANAESVVAHLIMGPLLLGLRWFFSLAPFFTKGLKEEPFHTEHEKTGRLPSFS